MGTLKEIYNYREMIFSMVRRDLTGRYKGSFLGFLWTFLNPLLQLIVYNFVFSEILKSGIEKYYLFLFVALIPWIFFSTCLTGGAGSVLNEKNIVSKIYFPREVLPIAFVTSNFVNMLYCFIIVLIVVIFSGVPINFLAWLSLPLIMIIEYIMAIGITLIVSAVSVYFRDLQYILGIVAMAWQFLTPIIYSVKDVPESIMPIFMMNPMTPIIIAYRDILYYGSMPELSTLLQCSFLGLVLVFVGYFIFGILKKRFAEEL